VQPSRRAQEHEADHVGEAGRAGVLQRALADPGLDQLEVRQARQAEPAPERQPDRQLQRQQTKQPGLAGDHGDQRQRADHGLIRARGVGVDHLQIAVGVGGAGNRPRASGPPG
jgi:hypothetical protein